MCTFSYILEQSGLTRSEFARALGLPPSSVNTRINGTNDIKISELEKVEEYVGRKLYRAGEVDFSNKSIQISPLMVEGIPNEYFKDRVVTELYLDAEIVGGRWGYKKENLRYTKMFGDKMAGGDYPISNEDILLVDVTARNIFSPGVYVFTTYNKNIFIAGVKKLIDGAVQFYYYNKGHEPKEFTEEQLQNAQFKVLGRVVKNLTLRI